MPDPQTLCNDLERTLGAEGPAAALDCLIASMESDAEPRALLDALLLRARFDLGLPAIQPGSLADIAEPARSQYEDRYVEAIRRVGRGLLDRGDIVAAWPYYRAIGEKEPVVEALDRFQPGEGDASVGHVVEIAFTQGAHPRRGFELILDHFGVCSAITSFEGLPPDEAIRRHCAERLTARLHEQLVFSLRSDIERRGEWLPPEGTAVEGLLEGRAWLFEDDTYHLDVSHLAAVVRASPILEDRVALEKALDLAEYGRRLSVRHQYEGDPPFEDVYSDHAIYLRGLLGLDPDEAISHFWGKLPAPDPDGDGDLASAQSLVRLLVRLGRLEEAIDVSAEQLAGVPEGMLSVPGVSQLCARAGRMERLAKIARAQGDPVRFAAAILPKA